MERNFSTSSAAPRRESEGGFTLLEILVAMTILGFVMATVYGAVSRTLQSTRYSEEQAEVYSLGRDVVLRMADEIEGALPLGLFGLPGESSTPTDAIQFVTVVRRRGAEQGRGGRALVSYSLDPLQEGGALYALRRHEELILEQVTATDEEAADGTEGDTAGEEEVPEEEIDSTQTQALLGPTVVDTYLLDNVVGMQFQYLDPESGNFQREWRTDDEAGADVVTVGLPAAVEILLLLADENGGIHDFRTHVDLPLANVEPTPQS